MVKLLSFPQREFSMSTWRYILNLCKNMSEAEASLVVAVLLIAATSLWAGNLLIGAVLALAIIFAMLVTLPLWGIVLILAGTYALARCESSKTRGNAGKRLRSRKLASVARLTKRCNFPMSISISSP